MNVRLGVRLLIIGVLGYLVALAVGLVAQPDDGTAPPLALDFAVAVLAAVGLLCVLAGLACGVVSLWKWTAKRGS